METEIKVRKWGKINVMKEKTGAQIRSEEEKEVTMSKRKVN